MAKVKIYRFKRSGAMSLQFTNGDGDVARYTIPITLTAEQWDGKRVTAAHPQRFEISAYLNGMQSDAQLILSRIMREQPTRSMSAKQLRDMVTAEMFKDDQKSKPQTFTAALDEFARTHTNARTRQIYEATASRIREYDTRELEFSHITRRWLEGFEQWLMQRSKSANGRAIHFRNIRAVFNRALDDGVTEFYPFRRNGFKIKKEETIHRDLTAEDLRILFAYEPPTERANPHATKPLDFAVKYIDLAKLSFCLIGMNPVDLFSAEPRDYYGGRINYRRAKTHKLYNIKVEPEAAAIIRKYRGETKLLSMCERKDYRSPAKQVNKALRSISKELGLPPVTMYWMRHSWATIAYSLGAPTDLVSDCLGHEHGSKVTATYINKGRVFNSKDELNRAVLDEVFGQ